MKKKIVAFILSLIMLIPALQSVSLGYDPYYGYVEFYDTVNTKKDSIGNESSLYAKLYFKAPADGDAVALIAKYDTKGILQVEKEDIKNLTPNEKVEYKTSAFSVYGISKVKVFIWDDMENIVPLVKNYGVIEKSSNIGGSASGSAPVKDKEITTAVTLEDDNVQAYVPVGTKVKENNKSLTLTVTELSSSASGIKAGENEVLLPLDIHVSGIADDNTVPVIVTVTDTVSPSLNKGNLELYHVENGKTVKMEEVETLSALVKHNQFHYEPLDGTITLAMATFSEVAVVADTTGAWEGNVDYSWYTNAVAPADGEGASEYVIANADQLAGFGAIVGGMAEGIEADTFEGKTVTLAADINLGDAEKENTPLIFHPIGYYYNGNSSAPSSTVNPFKGIFDGNGHKIANFYQNTWEIKGDYDANYYSDAMGLFGYVVNGTVKNLTVDNFSSDGEYTPTGVIAAYAVNSTFENIAITNCNPRVYNTGNGGIVGIGGNSDDPDTYKLTFTNITIDNTNKISALWGSYDVACGGLVGMFRGAGHVYMTNCHVAAQLDVYNDVCGNYQYYWYRYSGMMVGTNKNMTTDGDGYTVPETDKFHAENCTVHFGEWNNYWYCELVANTLASYTHDHQFSRLTEISSLEEIKSGETWTKTGNFLLISGDTKTCYHIVKNADGTLKQHLHADAGEETVNGKTVLKEDNQIIYLPFNQLFTGYGWGVKHIPVGEFPGVTILDREVANSVEKFESKLNESIDNNRAIKASELFGFKEDCGAQIKSESFHIGVTDLDDTDGTVTGKFEKADNWEDSTITLTGTGRIKITVQDYYFCTPTVVEVNVIERKNVEKFETKFTGDFLYRVGNQNAVKLDSLFKAKDGAEIGTVSVIFEKVAGNASGTYTSNATWTNGTIQFTGTGVVKVTITDNNYCIPTELTLEVVDAVNAAVYSDMKDNQNTVMLCDIEMASGGTKRFVGKKALYGNGFTFDVTEGAHAAVTYDYQSYVIYLENSTIDNVEIVGMVYPKIGGSKDTDYSRAIVMTNGDCTISNSYISNGASPIRNGGNLTLKNTTLKGGGYANLDLRNGHLILDNVTTINQAENNDKTADGNVVIGLGIVVYQEGGTEELKITIRNDFNQYNYLRQTEANDHITDTYGKAITGQIFGTSFAEYQNNGLVNTGIISMNNYFSKEDIVDERENNGGYFGTAKTVELLGKTRNCYVHSFKPSEPITSLPYESAGQGVIKPIAEFSDEENYNEGNRFCYVDGDVLYVGKKEDDTTPLKWNPRILDATKFGNDLEYNVMIDNKPVDGEIEFTESKDYTAIYTYTDPYNYKLDNEGNPCIENKTYTKTLTIKVVIAPPDAKNAVFSFGANGTAYSGKEVVIGDKTYVMPDVTATVSGKIGSKTVNGTTVYYPITEMYTSDGVTAHKGSWYACFPIFKDAVQIIDYADKGTGDAITYSQTEVTTVAQIPSTLKAVDPKTAFLYSMNATNYPPPTDPTAVSGAVCYTCNRSGLTSSNTRKEENTVAEYTYTDNAGKTYYYYIGYHCAEQTNGCVTPETLITLADGTQKQVQHLEAGEELLVWNLKTGKYDSAPIVFNESDAKEEHEIIHLYFADGSDVEVIYEHGFFDVNLGEYVYIRSENAKDYIGHEFVAQGNINKNTWKTTKLTNVVLEKKVTTPYSPVTFEHLCYYTDGVLSMPGGIEGLFNIFEVDTATMKYDSKKMARDIENYGLFTYEDFKGIIPEYAYEAFNGQYLKVAIGKGHITWEDILRLAERYGKYFN